MEQFLNVDGLSYLWNRILTLVNSKVSAAKSELIGGAPQTYDTLKEIADYIEQHKSVEIALNAAIGNKANKATTLAGYGITDALTAEVINQKINSLRDEITGGNTFISKITTSAGANINEVGTPDVQASTDNGTTTLTFNYLKGEKGEPGKPGENGQDGSNGVSPNLTIGNVSTGAAGSNAQASITGTFPDLKLNLTIPQGQKGEDGSDGQSEPTRGVTTINGAGATVDIDAAKYSLVVVNFVANINDLNFTSMPPVGKDVTVIFKSSGGSTVTIKGSDVIKFASETDVFLKVNPPSYVEANFLYDGTYLYARTS